MITWRAKKYVQCYRYANYDTSKQGYRQGHRNVLGYCYNGRKKRYHSRNPNNLKGIILGDIANQGMRLCQMFSLTRQKLLKLGLGKPFMHRIYYDIRYKRHNRGQKWIKVPVPRQ